MKNLNQNPQLNHTFFSLGRLGLAFILILSLPFGEGWGGAALAQWTADPIVNTGVLDTVFASDSPEIVSDGQGGAIIVVRKGNDTLRAQRMDASGNRVWGPSGAVVVVAASGESVGYVRIAADGAGGAVIVWDNGGSSPDWFLYAQRINASGNILWGTTAGVPVCTAPDIKRNISLIADGLGGAIVVWEDNRNLGGAGIYAQRMDANSGAGLWGTNGKLICSNTNNPRITSPSSYSHPPSIASDGNGGAIIGWAISSGGGVYAQWIDAAGIIKWTKDGKLIFAKGTFFYPPTIIPDGAGGAILTTRLSNGIFAQRINSNGINLWAKNGVLVCTQSSSSAPISDGLGGAIIAWDQGGIYAQRISSSGVVKWGANGKLICTAAIGYGRVEVTSDSLGWAIITWLDNRKNYLDGRLDIYAQRVDMDGTAKWAMDGVEVVNAKLKATSGDYRISSDGSGGAIVAFSASDSITYSEYDTYAQNICANGALGVIPPPSPTNVTIAQNLTICSGNNTTLSVSGVGTLGWYSKKKGGTYLGGGNNYITPTLDTTATFYVQDSLCAANGKRTAITVVVNPSPTTVLVASDTLTFCSGTQIKMTASGPSRLAWSPSVGLSATVGGIVYATPPAGVITYTVFGTENDICYKTSSIILNVVALPTITTTVANTICLGDTITLNASILPGTLLWSTGSAANTITEAPITNTTYAIFGTNNFCTTKIFVQVNVVPLPTISVGLDRLMCVGTTGITLNGSSTPGSYLWTPSDYLSSSISSNSSTNIANPPQIGVYNYTLTVTESHGCSNYDGLILRVDTVLIINAGSDLTVCSGLAIPINVTITAGSNIVWFPATALNSATTNTPTLNVPTAQLLNYAITVSAPGCNDESDNLSIQVLQSPILITSNVSICIGTTPTLTVSGADNYLWSDSSTVSFLSPLLFTSTNYTVLGTNNNGCTDTAIIHVNVNNLPNVDAGSNITASTAAEWHLNGSGASIYLWSPASLLNDATDPSTLIKNRITQKYNLIGTDANGCVNTDSVYIKYIVCDEIFVPDAFSPNDDKQNDLLEVIVEDSQCIKEMNLQIYDRWGTLVFETYEPEKQWDGKYLGKELTDAVFVYRIDIKNVDDKELTQKGNVSLIR